MTFKEIRDHKFKILFTYYTIGGEVDDILVNYFDNYPYESEEDENEYIGSKNGAHKNVNTVIIKELDKPKNESDKAVEISLGLEENIRDIKQKVKDIIFKSSEIDELLSKCLKEWDITRIGKAELTIIRLAIYEMYYDSSIDLEVAINEAVELAKVYADEKADKFVNGVLATVYKSKCETQ